MAYDWSRGISTGAGGAAAGSMFGPIGAGIGGLAGLFSGFGGNPADNANKYLKQIPGQVKPLYQPYIDAGKNALPGYQDVMSQLLQNPDQFINKLGQGYKESPGYKWNVGQGEQAVSNANAAGGLAGSPQHEQQNAEMVQGLASKDYNEYMQRVLQGLGMGTQGTAGLINQGASSAGSLADALAQTLGAQGGLKYAGGTNQGNNNNDMIAQIVAAMSKRGMQ